MNKFDINYSEEIIRDIKEKISRFNWNKLPDFNNWDLGINKEVLRDIFLFIFSLFVEIMPILKIRFIKQF